VAEKGAAKTNAPMAAVLALKPAARAEKPAAQPGRWEDAVAVVTVRGDLDRDALEAIDYAVGRATADAGRIVLDLLDVAHLDYAGVGLLVERRRELVARNGELLIAVRNPYVANILKAAGGAELVLCRTVEEASGAVVVVANPTARRRGR
jgi:anti-anti-sigma factor